MKTNMIFELDNVIQFIYTYLRSSLMVFPQSLFNVMNIV